MVAKPIIGISAPPQVFGWRFCRARFTPAPPIFPHPTCAAPDFFRPRPPAPVTTAPADKTNAERAQKNLR